MRWLTHRQIQHAKQMPTKIQFLDLAAYAVNKLIAVTNEHQLDVYQALLILNLWDAKDSVDCPMKASELFASVVSSLDSQPADVQQVLSILVSRINNQTQKRNKKKPIETADNTTKETQAKTNAKTKAS